MQCPQVTKKNLRCFQATSDLYFAGMSCNEYLNKIHSMFFNYLMFFFTYTDATASKNEMKIFQNFFGHSETGGEYAKKDWAAGWCNQDS